MASPDTGMVQWIKCCKPDPGTVSGEHMGLMRYRDTSCFRHADNSNVDQFDIFSVDCYDCRSYLVVVLKLKSISLDSSANSHNTFA